jgi:5-methylthioadenosine/S-adenosylhomocysteine deaminase
MFGEMDSCAKLHKLVHRNAAMVPAATVLRMGTVNGAAALGWQGKLGTLQPGQLADLIVVDFHQPHLTPVYNHESHLVYSARGADVLHTIIHGRIVMENRRILTFDADQAMAEVAAIAREIRP